MLVKLCKFYVAQNSKFNDISKTQQRKRQHLFNKIEKIAQITKNNNPPTFPSEAQKFSALTKGWMLEQTK